MTEKRVRRGMTKLVTQTNRKPKKKIVGTSAKKNPDFARAAGGWLGIAIEQKYADHRPLWGDERPIEKGWTPSSMGAECDRETVLKTLGYRGEEISTHLRRIFDAGNDIEARWIKRFQELGVYVDHNVHISRKEPPILSGYIDVTVRHPFEPGHLITVEIKSINSNGFRMLPAVTMDPEENFEALQKLPGKVGARIRGYMVQLQSYLMEGGNPEGLLLFDCKDNQSFAEYYIVLNEPFIQGHYDRLNRLNEYRERRAIPPCTCGGKGDFCKHRPDEDIDIKMLQSMTEVKI